MKKPMQAPQTLLKNATVITMVEGETPRTCDVLIEGASIKKVASKIRAPQGSEVVDLKGLVLMPGFVQCHVHTCQMLSRGFADDMELLTWLQERTWPIEGALEAPDVKASANLGMAELLLSGTTTILDMGTVHHTDVLFQCAKKMGLRYIGGKTIMDAGQGHPAGLRETTKSAIDESVRLCDKWMGKADGRLGYAFSPRFVLSCTEEVMRACASEAKSRGALLHTHASENSEEVQLVRRQTGMGNVEYLHSIGFAGENTLLAHGVWLSGKERKLLQESQTRIVHCPSANLKLGSGIARIAELDALGIALGIGADGAGCNNNLDAFVELRLTALLHKVRSGPEAMPATRALWLATRGGALALGLKDVGEIRSGMKADLQVLDLSGVHTQPDFAPLASRIVYSARASDVCSVMVDGRWLVRERQPLAFDTKRIASAANRSAKRVLKKAMVL